MEPARLTLRLLKGATVFVDLALCLQEKVAKRDRLLAMLLSVVAQRVGRNVMLGRDLDKRILNVHATRVYILDFENASPPPRHLSFAHGRSALALLPSDA
jgi:hypothetical protein